MITLLDGDGFLYPDGKAQNIIVSVDGKTFPFSATKSLQDLYEAVKRMPSEQAVMPSFVVPIGDGTVAPPKELMPVKDNGTIERGDILECLVQPEYGPDLPDDGTGLKKGGEYRVIDIRKQNGELVGYDVIDDSAKFQIRISVPLDAMRLKRKHAPYPKKKEADVFDVLHTCTCGAVNALYAKKGSDAKFYTGKCSACGMSLQAERKCSPIQK